MNLRRRASRIVLVLVALAGGCGRTELDLSTGDNGGAGGQSGRAGGAGGRGGASGAGGASPFACGLVTCAPAQTCCVGASGPVCNDAQTPCAGIAVACLDGSSCGAGQFCCFSLLSRGSLCESAAVCSASLGLVLCSSSAQCPSATPHCCPVAANNGFCGAQACP